jgi:exodeoxyribonuclease-3
MKIVSWNVNGIRAIMKKDFTKIFSKINADIFCIQETKASKEDINFSKTNILKDYNLFINSAQKKGYSGTLILSKIKPISKKIGIHNNEIDEEGRVITLEFDDFFLINCYTPNSQRGLTRIEYRMKWENDFRNYISNLNSKKQVIICGDLNVAHNEIDLKNPKTNKTTKSFIGNAGFSDREREKMTELLSMGFIDTFRYLYPNKENEYTWWSYMFHAREKNIGWRIDYFITSEKLKDKIKDSIILNNIIGSDHCPILLDINIQKSEN